ncbi:xyloglucan endotransglucosylase/hydrolase protein 9-like [Salvia hispanica]|uniref:xyloglucan endotransglucosylase/hydrolase protein 9-like n=1 Tax=Salvia hispanica TaxID=49212 RepID=UPI0020090659|nr:xyloglucan endotransglucosylase/hydrolase protein 9-like [Salvia hispanica]
MLSQNRSKCKSSITFTNTISIILLLQTVIVSADFNELFEADWAPDHIVAQGDRISLSLDSSTGCGFESKKKYLFGKASAELKLVQGDSAGTVTAYYMSSQGPNHDELDFEFLGNVSGEPYIVQTNLYINGTGDREQRHYLWFDPTLDFHTYSFLWNRRSILFLVDDIPIREYANKERKGMPYPRKQAMGIYGSLWNADDWATQGGRVKTNWTNAPFVVTFNSLEIDACAFLSDKADDVDAVAKCGKSGQFWWDKPVVKEEHKRRRKQLKWVRDNFLVYDYCRDVGRFPQGLPKECHG